MIARLEEITTEKKAKLYEFWKSKENDTINNKEQ